MPAHGCVMPFQIFSADLQLLFQSDTGPPPFNLLSRLLIVSRFLNLDALGHVKRYCVYM